MVIFKNKLIFALAAMFVVVSINGVQSQLWARPLHLIKKALSKDPPLVCHDPFQYHEGFSTGTAYGYYSVFERNSHLVGWYYSHLDFACKPLYLRSGVEPYEGNKLVPKSKDECETKCGTKCEYAVPNDSPSDDQAHFKEGVYSFDKYCVGGSHSPLCISECPHTKSYDVSCCERHFISTLEPFQSIAKP